MRKISCALFLTIFLAGLSSCQKDITQDNVAQYQTVDVTLTASPDDGVKVTLGKDLCPQWEDNDSLAVFDGQICSPFIISKNNGNSAEFGGRVSKEASAISAVYPFSAASGTDKDIVSIEFPETQYIHPGDSCCSSALICVASTDLATKHLSFQNVYALMKLDIDINGVQTIKISGKKGEILSGKGTVDLSSPLAFNATEGRQYVYLCPSEGTFKKGSYYLAIPAVSFAEGFSIEMMRNDGATAVKTTDKALAIQRNHGADLSSITFETKWKVSIASAEQLLAWNNAAASRTDFDEVELKADIDLGGVEWTPNNFRGTFEGNSHKIYNFTVTDKQYSGLFNIVYGTVRNLIIGSSDYNGVSGTWDGKTVIKNKSTEITGWTYLGSIASRLGPNSTVSGCVNFAPVEISAQFSQKACIGGIVGFCSSIDGGMKIENCINYGEVRNLASSSSVTTNCMGGITSKCEGETQISDCVNNGKVTCSNSGVQCIGGIIGVGNGRIYAALTEGLDYDVNVNSCTNNAEVVINDAASSPCAGGIIGNMVATHLNNCTNTGNITSWAEKDMSLGGIAGKFDLNRPGSIANCINGVSSDHSKGLVQANTSATTVTFGGVLGVISKTATADLEITGCKNYADITTDNPYTKMLGGFGGAWDAAKCQVTMSSCENYGNISNTAYSSDTGENKVGGFFGYFSNSSESVSTVSNCTNYGNVSTSKARKTSAQIGGFSGTANYVDFKSCSNQGDVTYSDALCATNAMNVGGIVGYGSNVVNYTDCTNSGKIEIGVSPSTGAALAGGIVGYNIGGIIDNCDNSGTVCVLAGYSGAAYAGGIAGKLNATTIQNGSDNTGTVYSTAETNATIGGIVGIMQTAKITIDGSTNRGTVYARKKAGHFLVGGIMGDGAFLATEIKNCVNEGSIYAEQTDYAKHYFTVGGIVGRSKGKSSGLYEIKDCINRGTVTVTANTDNQLCNAGGIVGETNTWSKVTGCINEASGTVSCVNTVAYEKGTRTAYAGGISGGDNEGSVGGAGNDTVTGNANSADVSAEVVNGATAIGAGGVFGMLQRTGTFSGNSTLGSAKITATGGSVTGGAGAVMGYLAAPSSIYGVTSTVSKSVLVNGASYESVKDMEAKLSAWLLPANNGNVTATFIDAQ